MNTSRTRSTPQGPSMNDIPPSPISGHVGGRIPSDAECRGWWDEYGMYDHIKVHSELVAGVATALAEMAAGKGLGNPYGLPRDDFVQSVRAAGLLHDLGKTWSIVHGGNHSQLGAAWTLALTGNHAIAQGVIHHVFWPGELNLAKHFLPLAVIYADKRVTHDKLFSIEERFTDLMARYGTNERSRSWIARSRQQNLDLEVLLSTFLGEDIHECFTDSRRLVG